MKNKIIYPNQKEIHDKIIRILKEKYLNNFGEAYLIGSLASGKFGKYENQEVSDIDIVAIPNKINKKWIYEGEFHEWHKRYQIGEIEIENNLHPISLLIPLKDNFKDLFRLGKELNWKIEKIK